MKVRSTLVVLMVAILLVSCQKVRPLRLVVLPSESASLTREHWEPVTEYLGEGLGQRVELFIVTEYAGGIEAMRYGHADIATFSGATDGIGSYPIGTINDILVRIVTGMPM